MLMIALQLLMQVLKLSITIEMMNILLNSLNQLNLQLKISVIPSITKAKTHSKTTK